jgi:hypothetical protein
MNENTRRRKKERGPNVNVGSADLKGCVPGKVGSIST